MNTTTAITAETLDLNKLEHNIDELIRLCDRLQKENAQLRTQVAQLKTESTRLSEKNGLARNNLESMVKRLKTLEYEL